MGSKSEDKSYVAGMGELEETNGRLAIETTGAAMVACGGEGGDGWGNSNVARWPCK